MLGPGEVYRTLCAERDRVRATVAAVTSRATADCSCTELNDGARALWSAVSTYTDLEDRLLPELLPTLDAWGLERLHEMNRDHFGVRRGILDDLARIEANGSRADERATQVALMGLTARVVEVLAREEERLVRADVLNDECINTDEFGG